MQLAIATRSAKVWDTLRSSYWFVPGLLTISALVLATVFIAVDEKLLAGKNLRGSWLYVGEPESARAILTTIATSMVTIATLTFSITIVVLTLAVSQFGSRLLHNFMRDRGNQFVLGTFIGTFIYCLVVLRQVSFEDGAVFVPHLSVSTAILLAVLGVCVLIYFIHHVAESIQANNVITGVSRELHNAIKRFFPEENGGDELDITDKLPDFDTDSSLVTVNRGGFVQAIDIQYLRDIAIENNRVIRLQHRPGDYVIENSALARISPRREANDKLHNAVNKGFILGDCRNLIQDIEFAFHQLVELALRALSPGINDPFTAISCVDELGSGLALVMQRSMPPSIIRDDNGNTRVIMDVTDFRGLVDTAFDQIRQHGAKDMAVMIHLLEIIAAITDFADRENEQRALLDHARLIYEVATANAVTDKDRSDVDGAWQRIRQKLDKGA